jgi:glycosyltransferase involved in cell wall biosynthesis
MASLLPFLRADSDKRVKRGFVLKLLRRRGARLDGAAEPNRAASGSLNGVYGLDRRRPTSVATSDHTVSLIVPTLDEAGTIGRLLADVPGWLDEVIVIDGPSRDGTLDVVAEACPRAIRLKQAGAGKGAAIKTGLTVATGDVVVTMDADGSMTFDDAWRMVVKLAEGCDFVKGSRVIAGGGSADFTRTRRAGNWALTKITNVAFGADYTDITYGFNAYWRLTMLSTDSFADGFQFEIQAAIRAARAGLRTTEVPCYEAARVAGKSKLNPVADGWAILKIILSEAVPRRRVRLRAMADLHLYDNSPVAASTHSVSAAASRARSSTTSSLPELDDAASNR